jgi:GT2 family glycosyltransferase
MLKYGFYLLRTRQFNLAQIYSYFFPKTKIYNVLESLKPQSSQPARHIVARNNFSIIIPIYNGFDYVKDLFDDLLDCEPKSRIILINDASTDERIKELIQDFCRTVHADEVLVIENELNLGFTHSVNKGLRKLKEKEHAIILNSDTRVPKLFGSKLISRFDHDERIASITPLTNAGTICTIPAIGDGFTPFKGNYFTFQSNVVEENWLAGLSDKWPTTPTGVGFCMAMSSNAIKRVGLLNEIDFAGGYGEENEWCLRASNLGFKHLICPSVFVQHVGGATFGPTKEELIKRNLARLNKKYPYYFSSVDKFVSTDPLFNFRLVAFLKAINAMPLLEKVLVIDHQKGGGATKIQLNEFKMNPEIFYLAIIKFDVNYVTLKLFWEGNEFIFTDRTKDLLDMLINFSFTKVIFNSFALIAEDSFEFLKFISQYTSLVQIPMVFRLHDYHSICPSLNLITHDGTFCEIPSIEVCRRCIPRNLYKEFEFKSDIAEWRHVWGNIIDRCSMVECYSSESLERLRRIFQVPDEKVLLQHHNTIDKYKAGSVIIGKTITSKLKIMTVGNLNVPKGLNIVLKLAKYLEREGKGDTIFHLGALAPHSGKYANFKNLGPYDGSDSFNSEIMNIQPDIFLFPSIWPETYSLVMDELIEFDVPKLAFKIGAPFERLAEIPGFYFVELQNSEDLYHQMMNVVKVAGKSNC